MTKATSELLLLDVNVLIALAWANHPFHRSARRRLEAPAIRWASCALTQLGFIRISANPAAVGGAVSPREAVALLIAMVSDGGHVYLTGHPAPAEFPEEFAPVLGHQQVTDTYLRMLARRNHARLLTFDARLKTLPGVEVLS
jgi:uncharacterized protein